MPGENGFSSAAELLIESQSSNSSAQEPVVDVKFRDPSLWTAARLKSFCEQHASKAAVRDPSVPDVDLPDPSLWTVALLKIYCEQHGLKKSGKKQDLLSRYVVNC